MCENQAILRLYSNVFEQEKSAYRVKVPDIIQGFKDMMVAYKADMWKYYEKVNFNVSSYRCAYLHKYAPLHTLVVHDVISNMFNDANSGPILHNLLDYDEPFEFLSLGAGPGSDVVAMIFALRGFRGVAWKATMIDCMAGWGNTFNLITEEISSQRYGNEVIKAISPECFSCDYINMDLFDLREANVPAALISADMVSMVKFVSAVVREDTESMVEKILNFMKPGALILFIDNASGGYHELVGNVARRLRFKSVFGPLKHVTYKDESFDVNRFGFRAQSETKVTIQMWEKYAAFPRPRRSRRANQPFRDNQENDLECCVIL